MMKRIGLLFLSMIIFIGQIPVYAASLPNLEYRITSDGTTTRYAQPGETITVSFNIKRLDSDEDYTVYSMQNYIVYDMDFFELIEDSCKTVDVSRISVKPLTAFGGIVTIQVTQINLPTYKSDFIAGEFKLKVKDDATGSGMVISQEVNAFCTASNSTRDKIIPEKTDLTVKIADHNEFDVEVFSEYVTGYHLVEVTGNNAGYLFDGNPMLEVERYNNKRVYLTNALTSTDYDALIEEARTHINPSDTPSKVISSGYNVNVDSMNDDNIDIYDASAVFAAWKNHLSVEQNMELYLRADINGNHQVNQTDLDDIVSVILSQ